MIMKNLEYLCPNDKSKLVTFRVEMLPAYQGAKKTIPITYFRCDFCKKEYVVTSKYKVGTVVIDEREYINIKAVEKEDGNRNAGKIEKKDQNSNKIIYPANDKEYQEFYDPVNLYVVKNMAIAICPIATCKSKLIKCECIICKEGNKQITKKLPYCPKCLMYFGTADLFSNYAKAFHLKNRNETWKIYKEYDQKRKCNEPREIPKGKKIIVYDQKAPKECIATECHKKLVWTKIKHRVSSTHYKIHNMPYCPHCDLYYGNYELYNMMFNIFEPYDEKNIKDMAVKYEERRKKEVEGIKKQLLKRKKREEDEKKGYRVYYFNDVESGISDTNRLQDSIDDRYKQSSSLEKNRDVQKKEKRIDPSRVNVRDFLVRVNVFKCMHDNHNLKNIDAVFTLVNYEGKVVEHKCGAGYCEDCDVFFIMENSYHLLRNYGVPLCVVTNRDRYYSDKQIISGSNYFEDFSEESILRVYGYNVSEKEGLYPEQRKKLLALLIDSEIISKAGVLSYLNLFINQNKTQDSKEKAVAKWEEDREFISEYNVGSYTQYGVGRLFR